jgi:D-alanyl-D-alanine carboxypeptidase/D-alanyl-D-alanine-endopeptidase (penicillin-binding protein 4)
MLMKKWVSILLIALLVISHAARAEGLPASVALTLKAAGIPVAATAVVVQQVDAPTPRVAVNARVAMNPASTMKLVTTFAALELLGPAYTWKTEMLASGVLGDGVLTGDLFLRGGGDPRMTYDQFDRLLRQLRGRGVREIRGDLVLDRSAFAVIESDPSRFDAQPTRPYNVAPDALLLNFKAVTLRLLPDDEGKAVIVAGEPQSANVDIVNQLKLGTATNGDCGDWRERLRADTFAQASSHGPVTRLVLTGTYPAGCGEQRWNIAVQEHPAFVWGVFRQLWGELGGSISGGVRDGAVPSAARSLAVLSSSTLAEVTRDINKYSNNVMARQLFITLGMESGRRPARAEDGETAVRGWLEARGSKIPELVLENGSGLSRRERISAESLSRLLQMAWKSAVMPELMSSLPVAATDGTMKKRLKQNGVAGQAHIKTGSLEGVRSIAGYVLDRSGRRWVVVFFVNHANAAGAQGAQDALLQWVYEQRGD